MAKRLSILLAAVAALVLVVSGCGSGSDSISKAELIKQGDAICAKEKKIQQAAVRKAIKANAAHLSEESVTLRLIATVLLPPQLKAMEEVAELGAPSGEEEKVEAIVTGMEKIIAKGEKNPAIVTGSQNPPFKEVNEAAAAYGFKVCSKIP